MRFINFIYYAPWLICPDQWSSSIREQPRVTLYLELLLLLHFLPLCSPYDWPMTALWRPCACCMPLCGVYCTIV